MFKKSLPMITRQINFTLNKVKVRELSVLQRLIFEENVKPVQRPDCVFSIRNYAKGRDVRKDKKKKVQIDENELGEVIDVEKLYKELDICVHNFKESVVNQATLRSTQGSIENFKIKFEGDDYTIQDLAEISKKNPKMYVLDFCNFPQTIHTVVSALQSSEMNLNVQQDGTKVFVPIPKVTKEHRESLAKKTKSLFVKCKESIRDVQMKHLKKMGKIEDLSQEQKFRITDQVNAVGDKYLQSAESVFKEKEKELLKTE